MLLTKLEHACVRLEKDGVTLVIDPAAWSMPRALEGASAVLVTHEHDIAQFAKRLLTFRDGKIRKDEPVPDPPRAQDVLQAMPALED